MNHSRSLALPPACVVGVRQSFWFPAWCNVDPIIWVRHAIVLDSFDFAYWHAMCCGDLCRLLCCFGFLTCCGCRNFICRKLVFFPPPPQYLFESSTEPAGPDEQKETLVLVWVGAIAVEFVCCSEFAMIVVGLIVCLVEVCLGV